MNNRLWTVLIAPICLILSVTAAGAADAQHVRQRTDNLLASPSREPTCEDWRKMGADATAALGERLASKETAPVMRVRAAYGLGCFETPAAGKALRAVLAAEETPPLIWKPALVSLARSQKEKALPQIKEALGAKDFQTRMAAVESAALLPPESVEALLREHLAQESMAPIKRRIEALLNR